MRKKTVNILLEIEVENNKDRKDVLYHIREIVDNAEFEAQISLIKHCPLISPIKILTTWKYREERSP